MDGNAERVIARLYALETPLPAVKPELRRLGEALAPDQRPGDFAQALMDLGATICTPRKPRCDLCPWAAQCRARKAGIAEELPRRAPKAVRPRRQGVAFWIIDANGAVLLRRRVESGLLGGMMEFPSTDWAEAPPTPDAIAEAAPCDADWRPLPGAIRHVFTHFELTLSVRAAVLDEEGDPALGVWAPVDRLGDYALPSLMVKLAKHALVGAQT